MNVKVILLEIKFDILYLCTVHSHSYKYPLDLARPFQAILWYYNSLNTFAILYLSIYLGSLRPALQNVTQTCKFFITVKNYISHVLKYGPYYV